MPEEFLTFQKFNDPALAEEIAAQLKQSNIELVIANEKPSFDPSFTYNETEFDYVIKIKPADFDKANKMLGEFYSNNLIDVDKDYYLFEFSDEQLKEIFSKPDEWGRYDYQLAKKILKDRNIDISDEKLTDLKKQRLAELSKPEKSGLPLLICGFSSAILFPLAGAIIGAVILSSKKTLPNGNRVWVYTQGNRKNGLTILVISIIMFVLISFNPDFAVGFVMRVSNAIQERVSGYFLSEEIVNYFEVKKCSENCYCAAVGSRNRISTAKSGFNNPYWTLSLLDWAIFSY